MSAADKIAEALTVHMVGIDLQPDDLPAGCVVVLTGSEEAVKAAAKMFGQQVRLTTDLADTQAQDGWLYHCPDSGLEWSEDHPHESGQCTDATDVRPATVENLKATLLDSWEAWAEDRERADAQAQQLEAQALELSRAKIRGDNHWETLKGIRHIAKTSGDLERIIWWVDDAGSGYTATPEESLAEVCDERNAARAEADALAQEIAELRAENERLRKMLQPEWFYPFDGCDGETTYDNIPELLDEHYFWDRPKIGQHVVKVEAVTTLPSIWAAVRFNCTCPDPDDCECDNDMIVTEHASEAEARAALGDAP